MSMECAISIEAAEHRLLGIMHFAETPATDVGVVIVVGGPQYRTGSHRQFVLLARDLAGHGVPVLRFDYSGMGDSEGEARTFDAVAEDIAAAVDALAQHAPMARRIVLWGLCDGASAALMYAPSDPRVAGLVLLNPWVRTESGLARSQLWTYYPRRLVSREFWQKIVRRPQALLKSVAGLAGTLLRSRRAPSPGARVHGESASDGHFLDRMLHAAERFEGDIAVLLSGNDITAGEFKAMMAAERRWRRAFGRPSVRISELPDANHTFSSSNWRNWVAGKSLEFVRTL